MNNYCVEQGKYGITIYSCKEGGVSWEEAVKRLIYMENTKNG